MKSTIALGLSLALVLACARPALSHQIKVEEPDHVLQMVAVVFYPLGDLLHHLLFGFHKPGESEPRNRLESRADRQSQKTKHNLSPQRKHDRNESEEDG
jgi:hypothetical protein